LVAAWRSSFIPVDERRAMKNPAKEGRIVFPLWKSVVKKPVILCPSGGINQTLHSEANESLNEA
jgi:hypothetical protein